MDQSINQSFAKRISGFGKKRPSVDSQPSAKEGTLASGELNKEYKIIDVVTSDHEMKNFLFSLGCYAGEYITVISHLADNYVIAVKDARYSIDTELAQAILV